MIRHLAGFSVVYVVFAAFFVGVFCTSPYQQVVLGAVAAGIGFGLGLWLALVTVALYEAKDEKAKK